MSDEPVGPLLEIATSSLASAIGAQEAGAARIELCCALELGGLTPSHAQIARVRECLSIPVHVLVRPRAGGFVYSDDEHATMLADIAHCVRAGCDGVVVGALTEEGNVDIARCSELVAAAGPLDTTFHRAIDVSRDLAATLEDVISLGFRRVLTSGGAADAVSGAAVIGQLVERAMGRIVVMPGAGIEAVNVVALAGRTGAREFHASARHRPSARDAGGRATAAIIDPYHLRTDVAEVRRLVSALRGLAH